MILIQHFDVYIIYMCVQAWEGEVPIHNSHPRKQLLPVCSSPWWARGVEGKATPLTEKTKICQTERLANFHWNNCGFYWQCQGGKWCCKYILFDWYIFFFNNLIIVFLIVSYLSLFTLKKCTELHSSGFLWSGFNKYFKL